MVITGTHDRWLVALSVLIAVAASFTALDLGGRVRASAGWQRRLWLFTAAVAMGGGIWAMHFVAMLAFSVPGMEVSYDGGLTLVSLVVAVAATGIGFAVMSRNPGSVRVLAAAGLFMGLGIVLMHYLGMAAMRMPADLRYDRLWVAISVLIAVGAATAALWLTARTSRPGQRAAAAAVMGVAVAGMHYAGMHAASFSHRGGTDGATGLASLGQFALAMAVAAAAFLILFLAMIAAMFDRRFALLAAREADALRQSEERFRSLYRGTPLPLHSLDADGKIEQVSNTWLELMGYLDHDVTGCPLADFLEPQSAEALCGRDWPELMATGWLTPRTYRAVTRGGAVLDVVAAARVERDEAGRVRHVLGGLTDVTERKRAEEALRQAQKIEAIGHLTGGVAHDFNNLLAVVIGNLDLLDRRMPPEPPTLRRLLNNAQEGANRGAALTQRLLAFARRQDLKLAPVDVGALVAGMEALLRSSLGPMIRVEPDFPAVLPPALADAHQLELALLNLGVNARDAMPNGGTLAIGGAADEVGEGETDLSPGRYVRVTVTDTGHGMDADTLARATEPFYTTKGTGKGTGLGLSMVQGLVAQSGGRLRLASEPGRGTTATLWLPVAREDVHQAPATKADAPAPAARSCAVLVVDDDPLVLANTAAMLEDLGHHVTTAAGGEAAIAMVAERGPFDLVVTDQLMPGLRGTELGRRLRELVPELPVLLVSGFAELGSDRIEDLSVLAKPFTQAALAGAIALLVHCGPE